MAAAEISLPTMEQYLRLMEIVEDRARCDYIKAYRDSKRDKRENETWHNYRLTMWRQQRIMTECSEFAKLMHPEVYVKIITEWDKFAESDKPIIPMYQRNESIHERERLTDYDY